MRRLIVGYPSRLEVAAYYVVAEALANAAKHAQASRLTVGARRRVSTFRLRCMTTELGERT